MALTNAQISSYIAKAMRAQEEGMLTIVDGKRSGKKGDSLYRPMQCLSAGVDVLTSNHGLTNLQVEVVVQKMIQCGNLNDFSGNPIPYLTGNIVLPSVLGIRITDLIDGPMGSLTSWPGYTLKVKADGSAWEWVLIQPNVITTEEGITAFAGGGQALAYQLTADYNYVDTVASPNDSVKLKTALLNSIQYVQNSALPQDPPYAIGWFPTYISGAPQIGIYYSGNMWFGTADYAVDLDTTMTQLALSVNTNTPYGTIPLLGFPFDNSAGFTATWNVGLQVFSLTAPVGSGNAYGGISVQFAYNGGAMGGGAGAVVTMPNGVNACDLAIYPAAGENIYGSALNAPIVIVPGQQIKFVSANGGEWRIS